MKLITLLRITGIVSFLFVAFHLAFPLMPYWKSTLEAMNLDMRFIFITYHYAIVAFLIGAAYITAFQTKQLMYNPIRRSLALLFASLYFIRIITELILWKSPMPQAAIILLFCVFPMVCYLAILFIPKSKVVE